MSLELMASDTSAYFSRFSIGGAYGAGNMKQLGINLNLTSKRNYTYSVMLLNEYRVAPDKPKDYYSGDFFSSDVIYHRINSIAITFGKSFIDKENTIKFNLQGGISMGESSYPYNFIPVAKSGFLFDFGPSHTYDLRRREVVGLILHPNLEFILSRYVGLRLGGLAHFNPVYSSYKAEICLLFGILRPKY
jgi:hypothetical protein